MATLRKKGNTYFIDYRIGGRRKRKSAGKSKKIAELALKDLEVKLARGEFGFDKKDSAYNKLIEEFRLYCKTNLAPSSQKRYKAMLDNFNRFLEEEYPHIDKLSHFTPSVFEKYKAFRKQEEAHNKTINSENALLRMIFKLAIQWGHLDKNPTDGVSKFKIPKKNPPRFLTTEECEKLLNNCGEWLYPIFYTFLNTGLRKSELENLEWSDIDFSRKKIKVSIKEDWSPKTNEREIPISNGLYPLLKEHKNKSESNYVFPGEDGKKIFKNRLLKRIKTLAKKIELGDNVGVHTLRHTFASHLVMKGVDLATIKQLLGHSDIETTMIYSHLTNDHVDKAVDKLNF
ncbi:MAG: tyrosine-type recombinase/integrase [Candidatus Omnitrophica bacterium]|nr:tyrosine-type recombinase/integrase [Candidatus Omnitrophota bacterium]